MKRREVMFALGCGMVVLWPTMPRAQGSIPLVGVLVVGDPYPETQLRAFRGGLSDLGYIEGHNVRIDIRSAEGHIDRLPGLAAELVRRRVDLILAMWTSAVLAAQHATGEIPIVMVGPSDPVSMGFVKSFAHPGGNITGVGSLSNQLTEKNVELLKEAVPALHRLAALGNAADPWSKQFLAAIGRAGAAANIEIEPFLVTAGPEVDAAFAVMTEKKVDAVIVQASLPIEHAAALALRHHLPSDAPVQSFPISGGLMAYMGTTENTWRMAATLAARILKGAKPADLPVEQPTEFALVINLKTAKALGLTVPPGLLARADKVIE
jgi:ABC-type uncharacterized transport system substrate-binding protein